MTRNNEQITWFEDALVAYLNIACLFLCAAAGLVQEERSLMDVHAPSGQVHHLRLIEKLPILTLCGGLIGILECSNPWVIW